MPITLTLLKNLSYPLIATTSAGSGALIIYFAKPETDLERKKKKWGEDMQNLRQEIEKIKGEAKIVEEIWQGRLATEENSVAPLVNFNLNIYDAKVTRYANCLDKLFDEISSYHVSDYNEKQRLSRCGQRPVPEELPVQ